LLTIAPPARSLLSKKMKENMGLLLPHLLDLIILLGYETCSSFSLSLSMAVCWLYPFPADTAFVSGCGFILCELELTLPKIWLEFRPFKTYRLPF
jgi:hypothetical protein